MCYFLCNEHFFVGGTFSAYQFKDAITTLLKANYRLKFSQDVAIINVRDKSKPQ